MSDSDVKIGIKLEGDKQFASQIKNTGDTLDKVNKNLKASVRTGKELRDMERQIIKASNLNEKFNRISNDKKAQEEQLKTLRQNKSINKNYAKEEAKFKKYINNSDTQIKHLKQQKDSVWNMLKRNNIAQGTMSANKLNDASKTIKAKLDQNYEETSAYRYQKEAGLYRQEKSKSSKKQIMGQAFGMGRNAVVSAFGLKYLFDSAFSDAKRAEKARGQLKAIGVSDENTIKYYMAAANEMTRSISDMKPEKFLHAAYAIKSALSGLSDKDISNITKANAYTAKATNANINSVQDFFTTAFSVVKKSNEFKDMDNTQFTGQASALLTKTVQMFKTTGGEVAKAMSKAAAAATGVGMSFTDQMAVYGRLMNLSISGEESGTMLKSFVNKISTGQQRLNKNHNRKAVNFLDANKQMLSIDKIMESLYKRYGKTMDAEEAAEVNTAFGEQGGRLITSLYRKISKQDVLDLKAAQQKGLGFTVQAASVADANQGSQMDIAMQRLGNAQDRLATTLAPGVTIILNGIAGLLEYAEDITKLVSGISAMLAVSIGAWQLKNNISNNGWDGGIKKIAGSIPVVGAIALGAGIVGKLAYDWWNKEDEVPEQKTASKAKTDRLIQSKPLMINKGGDSKVTSQVNHNNFTINSSGGDDELVEKIKRILEGQQRFGVQ